jgi:hypothetical protein
MKIIIALFAVMMIFTRILIPIFISLIIEAAIARHLADYVSYGVRGGDSGCVSPDRAPAHLHVNTSLSKSIPLLRRI